MTALIDWRADASMPSRTTSWPVWTLLMLLLGATFAGIAVVLLGPVSNVNVDICRADEAREGIPALEKLDVPLVGHAPRQGWVPPPHVQVRYVTTDEAASGTVVDETMCGQPRRHLLVTIAR